MLHCSPNEDSNSQRCLPKRKQSTKRNFVRKNINPPVWQEMLFYRFTPSNVKMPQELKMRNWKKMRKQGLRKGQILNRFQVDIRWRLKFNLNFWSLIIRKKSVGHLFKDGNKTESKRNILQKDTENAIDVSHKQRKSKNRNANATYAEL